MQKVELDASLAPWLHGSSAPPSLLTAEEEDDEEVHPGVVDLLHELVEELAQFTARKETPPEEKKLKEFTIFAPSNWAFKKLGFKIEFFLGSPFGRRILKGLLSYHVVPGYTFHSDYIHNSTVDTQGFAPLAPTRETLDWSPSPADREEIDPEWSRLASPLLPTDAETVHWPHPHTPTNVTHFSLPTLLGNHTLDVDLFEWRLKGWKGQEGPLMRKVTVKSFVPHREPKRVPVVFADWPAWRGAIHVRSSSLTLCVTSGIGLMIKYTGFTRGYCTAY